MSVHIHTDSRSSSIRRSLSTCVRACMYASVRVCMQARGRAAQLCDRVRACRVRPMRVRAGEIGVVTERHFPSLAGLAGAVENQAFKVGMRRLVRDRRTLFGGSRADGKRGARSRTKNKMLASWSTAPTRLSRTRKDANAAGSASGAGAHRRYHYHLPRRKPQRSHCQYNILCDAPPRLALAAA